MQGHFFLRSASDRRRKKWETVLIKIIKKYHISFSVSSPGSHSLVRSEALIKKSLLSNTHDVNKYFCCFNPFAEHEKLSRDSWKHCTNRPSVKFFLHLNIFFLSKNSKTKFNVSNWKAFIEKVLLSKYMCVCACKLGLKNCKCAHNSHL